ncbi:PucR family transcriptional regulator [Anaerocolumna jejuensis]|uniref:PucR family transcriptional regulator n=1 Tax=Anaerocolumna jejuensis TaxID=259063 RepID=UPI003F7B399A
MAITFKEILELDICKKLKLLGGEDGLDRVITWPFIKNMDTISEWIHGGELVFVIGAREDISEKGLLGLMKEAKESDIAGVVMLCSNKYLKKVPKPVIRYADENSIPLFKMPFVIKLIDITREISKLITMDGENGSLQLDNLDQGLLKFMLNTTDHKELVAYCRLKLQPLLLSDEIRKTDYVRTLQYYLEANNDLVRASQMLFIHRNTMVNRIRNISALLDVDINEAAVRNEYYDIYRMLKYFGKI